MARTRYRETVSTAPLRTLPAAALRAVLREGYSFRDLRSDVLAGAVVGVVALPLAMALSIAVGAPPQNGLYTSIVAGIAIAALGGSRTQVSGPTPWEDPGHRSPGQPPPSSSSSFPSTRNSGWEDC